MLFHLIFQTALWGVFSSSSSVTWWSSTTKSLSPWPRVKAPLGRGTGLSDSKVWIQNTASSSHQQTGQQHFCSHGQHQSFEQAVFLRLIIIQGAYSPSWGSSETLLFSIANKFYRCEMQEENQFERFFYIKSGLKSMVVKFSAHTRTCTHTVVHAYLNLNFR